MRARSILVILGLALGLAGLPGCGPEKAERGPGGTPGSGAAEELDFGEAPSVRSARTGGGASSTGSMDVERGRDMVWTILLRSFGPDDPRDAPTNFVAACASVEPRLGEARIVRRGGGLAVVFGRYDAFDDPAARRDLDWVKAVTYRERPLLPRAYLTRYNERHARGEFRPGELMGVRVKYPKADPLYSLQVAAWGDFESGTLPLAEVQRRAEDYALSLRSRGYEAYYHHDEDRVMSIVTIGLYDGEVWDAEAAMYTDSGITKLLKEFPFMLVNGERLDEPVDAKFPQLGTRPKRPHLVLVPKL